MNYNYDLVLLIINGSNIYLYIILNIIYQNVNKTSSLGYDAY